MGMAMILSVGGRGGGGGGYYIVNWFHELTKIPGKG